MVEHQTGSFAGSGGVRIFRRQWTPSVERCTMVLVPGAAEHSGRYHHVGRYFAARGVGVYALDHRGYGRSGGQRGHVSAFADYVADLHIYVESVWARAGRRPVMVGHSMGGLIALSYALSYPEPLAGLVLSSPSLGLLRWQRRLAPVLGALLRLLPPRLSLPGRVDARLVSQDRFTVSAYAVDPLICRKVTPRWVREFLEQLRRVAEQTAGLAVPSLWLQARDDRLVDPDATHRLFTDVKQPDKQFVWYPGRFHEIFNDPRREEVFADILKWLAAHGLWIPAPHSPAAVPAR